MTYSQKLFLSLMFASLQCLGMMRQIIRDDNGFKLFDGKQLHQIKTYDVDPQLRKMQIHQMRAFLDQGCQIRVSRLDNGDYVLRTFVPGLGGGLIGTTIGAFLGKATVSVVGHGALFGAACLTGPAFWVTLTALESTCGPAIEAASIKGAIVGGMIGAVATGPV